MTPTWPNPVTTGLEVETRMGDPITHYRIQVQGHLTPEWNDWFDGLAIIQAPDGTTFLEGPVADQTALYGLMTRLRDLGLTLIAVNRQ